MAMKDDAEGRGPGEAGASIQVSARQLVDGGAAVLLLNRTIGLEMIHVYAGRAWLEGCGVGAGCLDAQGDLRGERKLHGDGAAAQGVVLRLSR